MPVRSLNSSVMKWPRRETVEGALRQWVEAATAQNPAIAQLQDVSSEFKIDWVAMERRQPELAERILSEGEEM